MRRVGFEPTRPQPCNAELFPQRLPLKLSTTQVGMVLAHWAQMPCHAVVAIYGRPGEYSKVRREIHPTRSMDKTEGEDTVECQLGRQACLCC